MSMKTRLWVILTGLICALILLYGVLAGLLPQLADASRIRSEASSTEFLIETQQTQLNRLKEADQNSAALAEDLAELELAIPTSPGWAAFLRELQGFEAATGAVVSEAVAQPSILPESGNAANPAPAADAGADASGDAAATTPEAPVTGTAASSGLIEIPLSLTVTGTTDQVAEFLRLLQLGDRLLVISRLEIDASSETTSGIVEGSIYVAP